MPAYKISILIFKSKKLVNLVQIEIPTVGIKEGF